jgi:hypothetical protein
VQRALGNNAGVEIVAANRTMTAADAGKYLFSNANNLVYTLPNPATLKLGSKFRIAQGNLTSGGSINAPGSVTIGNITDGGTVSSVSMAQSTEYVLTVVSASAYQLTRLASVNIIAPGSAPAFACRAWVNFDGSTTPPTIRASGNVSSITDNGTGNYTVNFTTAMPDANYSISSVAEGGGSVGNPPYQRGNYPITSASNVRLTFLASNAVAFVDPTYCCAQIFR